MLVLAVVYFLTARLGLLFAMPGGNVTPVWPPSGLALAAMIVFGSRIWPGIWLGSFAANLWSFLHAPGDVPLVASIFSAAGIGAGGAATAWLGAELLRRFAGAGNPLERVRNVGALLGLGGVTACFLSATNGVAWLCASGLAPWSASGSIWLTWWLGDAAGVFVFASLLLAWIIPPSFPRRTRWLEACVCFGLLLAAGRAVFTGDPAQAFTGKPFTFVIIPFLVWPALRFGQRGAATAVLVTACLAVWGTIHGLGPFDLPTLNQSLLVLELFLSVVSLTALCIAAISSEQSHAEVERQRVLDELESRIAERTGALRASEHHLRAIIETEPECVKVVSPEGRLLEMNAAGLAMLDAVSLGELSAHPLPDLIVPEHRAAFAALHQQVMTGGSGVLEFETVGLKGTRRWLETHAAPLRDAAGRIIALLGVTRDITGRKRAAEKLELERRFSDTLIDGLPGVFYLVNPERRLVRWNKNFERVTGLGADELGRMDAAQLFPPDDLARVEKSFRKVLQHGEASVEARLLTRSGGAVPYFFTGLRMMTGDTPCMAGVGIDVSERRQSAALIDGQKEVLELIAKGVPLAESLTALLRMIESQSGEMLCSILLLDDDGIHVRHGAAPSLPEAFSRAIDGLPIGPRAGSCGTAAFRREPVIVEDIGSDPLWADYRAVALTHGLRACWSTPVFDAQKKVLGTFAIYYREPGRPTPKHERLIKIATQTAAIAIVREQTLAALRLSVSRHRRLIEANLIGVMIAHTDGRITEANDLFLRMVGHTRGDLLEGRVRWDTMTPPDWRAVDEHIVAEVTRTGACPPVEKEYLRKDGSRVPILASVALLEGTPGECICLIEDLTGRKRAEEALRDLSRRLLEAEDEERRRIAKELHDSTAQDLVAVMLNLGRLRDALPPLDAQPAQILEDSAALVENCAHEIRTLSYVLHPPRLDELGLPGGLAEYAAGLGRRADIRIRVEAAPDFGRLTEEMEIVLFRVAQESLGNVLRHADSDTATIRLAKKDGSVVLEIEDDGRGLPPGDATQPGAGGVGIAGMRERLQYLGGKLEIESSDRGTTVRAILPLKGETK